MYVEIPLNYIKTYFFDIEIIYSPVFPPFAEEK